ncbi:MAG: tripartite tricarboxylate transporter permease, partial [Geminicoccaceae bacterium]|nr:tripartite tricarboxylate transporter permease [Geminicoccaceae bacterium]
SLLFLSMTIPFAMTLEPYECIALLLGIATVSNTANTFSSVLIAVPGGAGSQATILDGYPMAARGEADLALGWATAASVFGGLFSLVVLVLAAPQLAAVALRFGPIETFALLVFALTCIAWVSRESVVKGLLAGTIGLFLAVVGPDPMSGDIRFNFGVFQLSAGLQLIPVLVGMFALAEVFVRAGEPAAEGEPEVARVGFRLPPLAAWRPYFKTLVRSSGIGSFIGVLPGTGAAVAAFISYAEAKRSSPRGDAFGTGEPEGLVASEAANNAVTGGALVPTLALGIPGDAATAVMMGTLLIQGITPGVRLFVDNPELVYAAFLSLFVINIVMFFAGMVGAQAFTRILRIPTPLLMAAVVVLALVGSYAVRGNPFDLLVTCVAGVVGYFMRLNGFPTAPVVIGMVLGYPLERALRQGLILTDLNFLAFFESPLALFLFALTLLLLLWPWLSDRWRRWRAAP